MRTIIALLRASWLTAASYKISTVISLVGILGAVVPVYFVSHALQSTMAAAISGEGHQYFGFLLIGTITFTFIPVAVQSLPGIVGSSINNGTLETVLSSPTPVGVLLAGLMSYSFLWTGLRAMMLFVAGWALGAAFNWHQLPLGTLVLVLIVAAHIPIGLIAASAIVAFRTAGPIPQAVLVLSSLLGGVYYPTHIIPSWLAQFSAVFPLTYGLRALRRVIIDGRSVSGVSGDLAVLLLFTVVLYAIGLWTFSMALRYARRHGTLSNY